MICWTLALFAPFVLALGPRCPAWSQNSAGKATRELVINACGVRFRASTDAIEPHIQRYKRDLGRMPPFVPLLDGYSAVKSSGSSQFCLGDQLRRLFSNINDPFVMVDLRMESHGFIDKLAVCFFCPKNWDLLRTAPDQIESREEADFAGLTGPQRLYHKIKGTEWLIFKRIVSFSRAMTERQAMEAANIHYERIPIPDHQRPRDTEVEQLLDLFKRYPDHWMHFHCKAGKGRTTTAMIMRDMWLNAKKISAADIIMRNSIFGAVDLLDLRKLRDSYRLPFAQERMVFLYAFYKFCLSKQPSWLLFINTNLQLLVQKYVRPFNPLVPIEVSTSAQFRDRHYERREFS